ncbi:MAG TPA: divalent-cation tolerance protein CutA [Planctomycetota bacterium]|nr:divalent-cation tolerance protein CutA [Planctomycetota bacterium]
MSDAIVLAYITTRDADEAQAIGRTLVEERWCACVNILPGMRSIYRWQGRIEQADEAVLIAKTRATLFPALAARVRALHSYRTPCVIELRVDRGDEGYVRWLLAESGDAVPG